MTELEQIRNIIDDHPQIGFASEVATGKTQVIQLNTRNFYNLTVKDKDGEVILSTDYESYPQSGQLKGAFPEGDLEIDYVHAGFTDAEIMFYLEQNGSVKRTALALVKILLASSAKRFDYKAGIKDIKASQVFDHLKELHNTLLEEVLEEDSSQFAGGIVAIREHPAYAIKLDQPVDVSRGILR